MGLKRRRGSIVIMVAGEEDLDYYENAYESLAETVTIKADLGNNNIITLTMGNKEERAQRDLLTQEEKEVQDNIQVIKENRYQVKIISFSNLDKGCGSVFTKKAITPKTIKLIEPR